MTATLEELVADAVAAFVKDHARQETRDEAFLAALEQLGVSEQYLHTIRHDLIAAVAPTIGVLPLVLLRLDRIDAAITELAAATLGPVDTDHDRRGTTR